MRQPMNLAQAKFEVEQLLEASDPLWKCTIYLWWDGDLDKAPPPVGIRIAEIDFVQGAAGSSYMSEPKSLGLFAAAERAIIERMVCTSSPEDWDGEVATADWCLKQLLNPEETQT